MFAQSPRSSSDIPLSTPRYPSFSGSNSGAITELEGITTASNTRNYFANHGRRDIPQSHPFTDTYSNPHYFTGTHDPSHTIFPHSYNRGANNPPHDLYSKPLEDPIISSHTRRGEIPLMIDTYNIGLGYTQSSSLGSGAPSSSLTKSTGCWSEVEKDMSPQSSRPRKQRREKPRIDLAPDQPPTTQGKPRERVYVACLQWQVIFFFMSFCISFKSFRFIFSPVGLEKFDAMVQNLRAIIVPGGQRAATNAIMIPFPNAEAQIKHLVRASALREI